MHEKVTLTKTMMERDIQNLLWIPFKIFVNKIEKIHKEEESSERHGFIIFVGMLERYMAREEVRGFSW